MSVTASDDELKKAYRRVLRAAHPDTGGSSERFVIVQQAWERIGTVEARARYDRGNAHRYEPGAAAPSAPSGSARAAGTAARGAGSSAPSASSMRARSHGHPGGAARGRYVDLLKEWVGRGIDVPNPYAPELVQSAPRDIRWWLGKAMAEEQTAREVGGLGIGYSVWNDVIAGKRGEKIDHIVLGPAGLFAIASEDWGSVVRLRKGELVGEGIHDDDDPVRELGHAVRSFGRMLGVRVSQPVIVVPDTDLDEALLVVERGRNAGTVVVRRSLLPQLLRDGLGRATSRESIDRAFDIRTRLQQGIRLL